MADVKLDAVLALAKGELGTVAKATGLKLGEPKVVAGNGQRVELHVDVISPLGQLCLGTIHLVYTSHNPKLVVAAYRYTMPNACGAWDAHFRIARGDPEPTPLAVLAKATPPATQTPKRAATPPPVVVPPATKPKRATLAKRVQLIDDD